MRKTPTSDGTCFPSKRISRSSQTSGTGAASGRNRATGCGSNVIARAGTPAASALARPAQKPLMASVDSVEVADRDDRPLRYFGDFA